MSQRVCMCVFIAYYEYELPKEGDMIFLYLLLSILQTSGDKKNIMMTEAAAKTTTRTDIQEPVFLILSQ